MAGADEDPAAELSLLALAAGAAGAVGAAGAGGAIDAFDAAASMGPPRSRVKILVEVNLEADSSNFLQLLIKVSAKSTLEKEAPLGKTSGVRIEGACNKPGEVADVEGRLIKVRPRVKLGDVVALVWLCCGED